MRVASAGDLITVSTSPSSPTMMCLTQSPQSSASPLLLQVYESRVDGTCSNMCGMSVNATASSPMLAVGENWPRETAAWIARSDFAVESPPHDPRLRVSRGQ
jgi:hypothetical protein